MTQGQVFPKDSTERERSEWVNAVANMWVFAEANQETTQLVISNAVFRRRRAGDRLVDARAATGKVHFLISGIVRVFQEQSDLQYTPKLLSAPAHFGDVAALAGLPHAQSSLEMLTNGVTAEVSFALIETRLAVDPALCRAWLYSLSRQFAVTIDYLKQNIFGGLPARIANVLLSYAEVFGAEIEPGWRSVGFELSYADLARQTACSRRAAINTMNAMQETGAARQTESGWQIQPELLLEELLPGRLSLRYSQEDNRDADADSE